MANVAEPLKTEEEISGEVMIGGCSRKSLDAVVRELGYSFDERQRGGSLPKNVHIYCRYQEEGQYVTKVLSEKLGDAVKVQLSFSEPPHFRESVNSEFQIDLSWFIDAAKKPNSYLNRR